MTYDCKKIFVGGYSKSGTTFIGRAFGIINGVYARGEEDYFRQMFNQMNKPLREYNTNLHYVNKEVYDGQGTLKPLNNDTVRAFHQFTFYHLFFNGNGMPADCKATVEKSPHNINWIDHINFTFPDAQHLCVFRSANPVFRSLLRHMRDNRNQAYGDPESDARQKLLRNFCKQWSLYLETVRQKRNHIKLVRYDAVAADTAGFLDFAQTEILGEKLGLAASVETLTKEYYLSTLPAEARAKSLVQTTTNKVVLSDREEQIIAASCGSPDTAYDF